MPINYRQTSSICHDDTISQENSSDFTVTVLMGVLDPHAPAAEKALAHVIRTLAKHLRYEGSGEDLETLLAVSVALARCAR